MSETDAPDFVRGQFAGDLETVQRDLARTGFDFGRSELIEGFFAAALH